MNTIDLVQFQFDYDLTWAAFFMNADGTIYGRYGIRASEDAMDHLSLTGLTTAMRRALELHKDYPKNRALFSAKRGSTPRFKTVSDMPSLRERLANSEQAKEGCIHCHMLNDGAREVRKAEKSFDQKKDIWVYPLPENVGMTMKVDDDPVIESVASGSFADKAGLKAGDVIRMMNGQAIISQADIAWVLHNLPTPGKLRVSYARGGKNREATLNTVGDWRKTDISWRASMWGLRPDLGFWSPELSAEERLANGLAPDALAMKVRWIPREETKRAGLQNNDILVSFDGDSKHVSFQKLSARVRLNYEPGTTVPVVVIREGKRVNLTLPLVGDE
ncbi:PDZ domain-containing protein [Candidatus Poribacteria bacterium]|nr:PDZ domain-containing protein [Candidatus Poribacteria bacterium]